MKIKDSLNLPKTNFPMRANLPQNEPKRLKAWDEFELYQKIQEKNESSGKSFTLPDGPPYANGNIHLGHVLNKVLKDITIKYKSMRGYQTPFIPGWDGHGLPIELKVSKELGPKRREKTKEEIRSLCRKEAYKWVKKQEGQFRRLGIFADWENPYITVQADYEAEEVRQLAQIYKNNLIYKGKKPVFWCPTLQTALADTEVEYQDHESPSIYVKFKIKKESLKETPLATFAEEGQEDLYAVIWTTTPWTIPANLGISIHPDFDYQLVKTEKGNLLLAKELVEAVSEECSLQETAVVQEVKGSDLEKLVAEHPFISRDSIFLLGDHVTLDAGTGLVHTAPGHGVDDYQIGLKYGLEVYSPVGPDGRYTKDYPEREGEFIFEANDKLVEQMREQGSLLFAKKFKHSYPHNWRSKTPLIFRATPQWFIAVDHPEKSVRKRALELTESDIKFYPNWGKTRLESMIQNRPDWCISRQRIWGVPIPVLNCNSCGETHTSYEFMMEVADRMEKSGKGIEAYFEGDLTDLYPESCSACGAKDYSKSEDILDVWFDSGVCHSAVQKKRKGLKYPADIYLEGSDQHRGWFQTSLLSSVAAHDQAPFKALVTHGFVNDANGRKMSKSLGNVIDPLKVIQNSGAEILRLWVAYEDYGQDVNISEEIFSRVTETYRRVRNTMRFILGNLKDYKQEKWEVKDLDPLDQWALLRLNKLIKEVKEHYDNFNYYKVYHALNIFFTVDLSARYLDILKDRLYVEAKDSEMRRSSLYVLSEIVKKTSLLMAPILSFLSEEVFEHYKDITGDSAESVFLMDFPEENPEAFNEELEREYDALFETRSVVSKGLEEMRAEKKIKGSLEAKVILSPSEVSSSLWEKYKDKMEEFFIVSQVDFDPTKESADFGLAEGEKCVRCWHIKEVKEHSCGEKICNRCREVMDQING